MGDPAPSTKSAEASATDASRADGTDAPAPAATKRPSRPRLPSESYSKSLVILLSAFVVHFAAETAFEYTLLTPWAKAVSTWVWSASNWVAIVPVVVYFVIVMWHLYVRDEESKKAASKKGGPGTITNYLLIAWNLGLTSASMFMLAGLVRGVFDTIRTHGAFAWVCDGESTWSGNAAVVFHSHMFLLSKFPELLDTAFLVIRGKDVKFLHWYHHISVLLYCWYVTQARYPATFFALVNAFVHSIMYYYYFRMAQGIHPRFAKMVTMIQLLQMLAGLVMTGVFFYLSRTDSKCNGGTNVAKRGLLHTSFAVTAGMYFSYFVLFAVFYIERYCNPKPKSASHED